MGRRFPRPSSRRRDTIQDASANADVFFNSLLVETIQVTLELPVSAPLKATVRALEAARDAYTDPKAKQALAAAAALASRGLVELIAAAVKRGQSIAIVPD